MNDTLRQLLTFLVLVIVLVINAMAGSGELSGESIGVVANRFPSAFLPAGWVFSIWSVIYLGLTAFALYQAFPAQRSRAVHRSVAPLWIANGILNVGWVVAFSHSQFALALMIMVGLLVSLVVIEDRVLAATRDHAEPGRRWKDYFLVQAPFQLYLAWISVAMIANTFQFATYMQWDGFGVPGHVWSMVMMGVASGLGVMMVWLRGNVFFPLVVVWALAGIADRSADPPLLATVALVFVFLGAIASAGAFLVRRSRLEVQDHPV